MKKMDNKGFSLVELIIVIAIMAILVGVLAPQFVKYVEQSRESADLQAIDEVKTAIETLAADYGISSAMTVTANSGAITYSAAGKSLNDYGVSSSTKLKSTKITGLTWTYQDFKWTLTGNLTSAAGGPYYDAYGSKF
jgi:type IV pilus assembly protein PilA